MKHESQSLSRRSFLHQASLSGLALTIGIYLPLQGKTGLEIRHTPNIDTTSTNLLSWISIDTNGKVTIMTHRSEMGQGTYQAIPQIIAEELEVNLDDVIVNFAPANPAKFGPQPQDGSFSVRGWYQRLLHVGASARTMLIEAAAMQWNVSPNECFASNGHVYHNNSGRKLGYGQLVEKAVTLKPPTNVKLKERKDYKLIGKSMPRKDVAAKITGSAIFGMDKKLQGMLYAVIERNPRFHGNVKSFDASATQNVAGVKHVFKVQRSVFDKLFEGVAVVADSLWAAMQGRKLLKIEWEESGFEHVDSDLLIAHMQEGIKKVAPSPTFEDALQKATHKTEAVYYASYQSHSCMEPLNCTADVKDNSIEIWGPIQEANWIQADLSERMKIPIENVTVNMTFLGGGFGRKAFTDYPYEAALISKQIKAPVQVFWTREVDMASGPFRSGAMYACRGGVDQHGKIFAFQSISAEQSMSSASADGVYPASENSGNMAGMVTPYYKSIPHYSFGGASIKSPIPTMWWRAPGANTGGFACESFIDELAHIAGKDPLQFRKSHMGNDRYLALLEKLEICSHWKLHNTKGWGVAITECFGSIVGQVVKVYRNKDGKIKIEKVTAVIDCGWYVNPDIIHAQIEGSIVMGLGAAIKHATHFKDGKAVEKNFNTYQMPRITDTPVIEVHIMENNEPPGGVGEPGLPPFAPALCNAIFDLTGKRVRQLPFEMDTL